MQQADLYVHWLMSDKHQRLGSDQSGAHSSILPHSLSVSPLMYILFPKHRGLVLSRAAWHRSCCALLSSTVKLLESKQEEFSLDVSVEDSHRLTLNVCVGDWVFTCSTKLLLQVWWRIMSLSDIVLYYCPPQQQPIKLMKKHLMCDVIFSSALRSFRFCPTPTCWRTKCSKRYNTTFLRIQYCILANAVVCIGQCRCLKKALHQSS